MNDLLYKLIDASSQLRLAKLSFPFLIGAYRLKTDDSQFGLQELLGEIRKTSLTKDNGRSVYISLCTQSEEFKIEVRNTYGTSIKSPFITNETSEPIYYENTGKILGEDPNFVFLELAKRYKKLIDDELYSFDTENNLWRNFNQVEIAFINAVFNS